MGDGLRSERIDSLRASAEPKEPQLSVSSDGAGEVEVPRRRQRGCEASSVHLASAVALTGLMPTSKARKQLSVVGVALADEAHKQLST